MRVVFARQMAPGTRAYLRIACVCAHTNTQRVSPEMGTLDAFDLWSVGISDTQSNRWSLSAAELYMDLGAAVVKRSRISQRYTGT